jgi:hypothetical protein
MRQAANWNMRSELQGHLVRDKKEFLSPPFFFLFSCDTTSSALWKQMIYCQDQHIIRKTKRMRLLTHKSAVAFAPGIPQTTTQLIMNVLDFGMDMQEAIEAPRVSLPYETEGIDTPSAVTVNVEGRIHEAVCDGLTSRGHIVELKEDWTMFFGGT